MGFDIFMQSPERMLQLLNGIEKGTVQPSSVGWRRSVHLMNNDDFAIRSQARRLLDEKPGMREEVIKQYQTALTLTGDAAKGKAVFTQVCSSCHQMGGSLGNSFGPRSGFFKKPKAGSYYAGYSNTNWPSLLRMAMNGGN